MSAAQTPPLSSMERQELRYLVQRLWSFYAGRLPLDRRNEKECWKRLEELTARALGSDSVALCHHTYVDKGIGRIECRKCGDTQDADI